MDAAALTEQWTGAWGTCRPVAHELRSFLPDRWVRFHSLPGSKRYPGNEHEYAEVLRRHRTVLGELLDGDGGEDGLVILTVSWSGSSEPEPRTAELSAVTPGALYWTSVLTDASEPGEQTWTHLWASRASLHSEELPALLRLVADDKTAGVIITFTGMRWLYHPYDGGADVIAATSAARDELRAAHTDWLSVHSAGL
jgi:hypothetical protein